ncbi:Stage II sporulation E [Beggiatoa sp. PS]|nr:Stage II sporulation E [Beggiatoa sp. PS]
MLEYEGRVKIGIADVTGHGLESGILAIMAQAMIRALMTHQENDAIKFLTTLNRTIYDNVQRMDLDKQLTLTLLDYQPSDEGGQLRISGQHEDVIVVRGGEVELIDTTELGFPIGVMPNIGKYVDKAELSLTSGDIVVLYTDGITEAFNSEQEQYGLERLCEVIQQNRLLSSEEIRQAVIKDLRAYIGQQTVFDDITLLIIKQK